MRVARILSHTELVITIDKNQKITTGTRLDILDDSTDKIIDPVTKKDLGGLPILKETVNVKQVFSNFCIAGKNGTSLFARTIKSSIAANSFKSTMINRENLTIDSNILNVNDSEIEPEITAKSSEPIHIGDAVVIANDK